MNIDAIILAGGLGTRLREVISDIPKPLAKINDTPFLDILISKLESSSKIGKIILAIGYKSEKVIKHYKNRSFSKEIIFSIEEKPLGTGGALKKALEFTHTQNVLVLNGDSFLDINLDKLFDFHNKKNPKLSIAVKKENDATRYGSIILDEENNILSFQEKSKDYQTGFINAGIYIFNKDVFPSFPNEESFSLESDFFSKLPEKFARAFKCNKTFIDIGTKNSYHNAQKILQEYTL